MAQKGSSKSPTASSKPIDLESLLTSPAGFGLITATPMQRAICRAMDGRPLGELWESPEIRAAFGDGEPPLSAPATFLILAGIRGAKSMIAAAKAIAATQNADLSECSAGDEIRVPVLSTDKDAAHVVFSHIVGNILAKKALKALIVGEPTADSVWLRHPSGRPIEIKVTALARAGSTLVGRWLAGCIFDEAPRMVGSDEGKRSLDEALSAIAGRMKGQIILIGSPWAPFGPVYNLVQEHFGRPTRHVCVVRAPGPAMNPVYWTPQKCAEIQERDPVAYRTDVLGEFADPEEALFSSIELDAATRKAPLVVPPKPRHFYCAAMDPATRSNAWTLVVVGCTGVGGAGGIMPTYEVVLCRQWLGSKAKPLRPDEVLAEIAAVLAPYQVDTVVSDQHSIDAVQDLATRHGLTVHEHTWTAENRLKLVENVKIQVAEACLVLPPDPVLRTDLITAKKRVTQNGVTLVLPKSADGRHSDYVPALALALAFPPEPPEEETIVADELMETAIRRVTEQNSADVFERAAHRLSR
jgi:hypothetical protein